MRILIVSRHNENIEIIKSYLAADNYIADMVDECDKGLYLAETYEYGLIILGKMHLTESKEFCRSLRENGSHTPILVITLHSDIHDTIQTFDYGADDCISYPFNSDELLARVRALLRRPHKLESETLAVGDLIIDTKKCLVHRDSQEIYLTRKEFFLLEHFMRSKNQVLSRSNIMEQVWGTVTNPFSNTLESHIRSLRRKIESEDTVKLIITVPGRGYKIKEPY